MVLAKFKTNFRRFFQPGMPPVSCEIARDFVSMVRLNSKDPSAVERSVVTPLPEGLVVPSLSQPNITSLPDLVDILRMTMAKAEIKTTRISVAIPDSSVKVAIHHLEKLPSNEIERQQLLKWRLKKTTPFNVEDSHLAYQQQLSAGGKVSVITVIIYREVLSQYQSLFQGLGLHAGFITPASLATFELLLRSEPAVLQKSLLFLRWNSAAVASMIVQQGSVVFFRHLDYFEGGSVPEGKGTGSHEKRWDVIYNEIHPCLMYYQDKLGASGIDKVYILANQDLAPSGLEFLTRETGSLVVNLDPMRLFRRYPSGSLPVLKNALAPALGLALGST
jgi:type IV pilus assembly protein PilM